MFLNDVSIKEKDLQFKNFALNWIETKLKHKLKPSSYLTKISSLENYVNPYIGEILIHKLSHKDIQDMINQLTERGLSYSITKKAYEVVTGALRYYRVLSNQSFNPSEGIELPQNIKPDIANHNYFTAEERKLFEVEAHKTHQNGTPVYRNAPALLFLMYTGLRISEALALTWADIDFEDNSIYINKSAQYLCLDGKYEMLTQHSTKTASSVRVIPMTQKSREALIELKRMSDGNNVISTINGKSPTPQSLGLSLTRISRNAGIIGQHETRGLHSLRHTFATMLFENNCPVKIVSELLGHSNTKITENIYIHIIQKQKIKAIEDLDKYCE